MKIYPVTVNYTLLFLEQLEDQHDLHMQAEKFYQNVRLWMKWDTLQTLAYHHDIEATVMGALDCLSPGKLEKKWFAVLKSAILYDMEEMSANLAGSFITFDRARFEDLTREEVNRVLTMLQSLIDNGYSKSDNLQKILMELVSLTGVQRNGSNPLTGGGFADIWEGTWGDKKVALKVLRIFGWSGDRSNLLHDLCKEAIIWRRFKHENVLPFYGCCTDAFHPQYALVSPWMKNSDMMSFLKKYPRTDRLGMVRGVASGLCYLHTRKPHVVHGDLRGANVLIDDNGIPVIADFGLARVIDSQATTRRAISFNGKGSIRWQAPELLHSEESVNVSRQSDVYAFACVILEVFTDEPPFSHLRDSQVLMAVIIRDERPRDPGWLARVRGLDDNLWKIMKSCWATQPSDRPDIRIVLEMHPFSSTATKED
ncbi:kinase-like protein [Rickenella mellea]|uniref:Kinase-like protein n=1 Tax=Rickenella mellea TaxID=50990 RepID=A0A4Y7QDN0_9AGAM|nr:kinase-like protein [Rickenella mellea]